jgi:hypothetical protein
MKKEKMKKGKKDEWMDESKEATKRKTEKKL